MYICVYKNYYINGPFSNLLTQFLCQVIMYPENPEGTQVIVGSMNMGYISDTARNRTHNLFRPKQEPINIPLGHSTNWPSFFLPSDMCM